jgi:hypothetical protein
VGGVGDNSVLGICRNARCELSSCSSWFLLLPVVAFWSSKSGSVMKRVRFDAYDDPRGLALGRNHIKFEARKYED